jgi:plasmid stabilization system protein ParE
VKIVIRDKAFADLEEIHNWIAADSVANARSVVDRIYDAIERTIGFMSFVGRAGLIAGTRE